MLGDEELPWDAERPKAEVTAFQPVIWSWIKGLDHVFWSSTHQEAVLYMGQVVKIRVVTVRGQKREGDKVGEIRYVVSGAVGEGWRQIPPACHPLVSTCCSQKTFHPPPRPEATVPLRPELPCDLPGVLGCVRVSSRTHWWL